MKIKIFKCSRICNEDLLSTEKQINDFTLKHKVIDIKVNVSSNNYCSVVIYTVLYKEE